MDNKSYSRNRPLPRALPVPRVVVGEGEYPVRGQPRPELLVPARVLAEAVGEEHQALHVDVVRVSLLGPRRPPVPAEDPAVAAVGDLHSLRVADHAAERKNAPFHTKCFFFVKKNYCRLLWAHSVRSHVLASASAGVANPVDVVGAPPPLSTLRFYQHAN